MGLSEYRFSIKIPIRYGDIDAQRHLNNVAYFRYMEQARVEYIVNLGLWPGQDFQSIGIILAEATCTYRAPAFFGESVVVWTRVSHLGKKSFSFEYKLETERGEIATARTTQVCYDYTARCSIPMPENWREAILAYEPGLQGAGRGQA
jgi:acyl-CoA thioester hydrolase